MIIGIGHKARHGKDTVATILVREYGFHVLHFADALYEECRNLQAYYQHGTFNRLLRMGVNEEEIEIKCSRRRLLGSWDVTIRPLRARLELGDAHGHALRLTDSMFKWIHKRGARVSPIQRAWRYTGMTEKDPELLQIIGTEYRRNLFGDNYWIDQVHQEIKRLQALHGPSVRVVIPDTRFRNEATAIKRMPNSEVWKVHRDAPTEPTGRPADHPSEIDLDNYLNWNRIIDNNGTLADLRYQVRPIMDALLVRGSLRKP